MLNKNKIREIAGENKKKVSKEALEKVEEIIEYQVRGIINRASRKSDLAGRIVIKKEDIME